jgi:hypothetical protein
VKLIRRAGLVAGLICLVVPVSALGAGPANVTVRAEGDADTLLPRSAVTTTTTPVNKTGRSGEQCSGTSAAGALERATNGDWAGTWSQYGYSVDAIKKERHTFSDAKFWSVWLNGKPTSSGVCDTELQEGDALLFFPQQNCFGANCDPDEVLDLQVPATAQRGVAFTAKVVQLSGGFDDSFNPTVSASPAAGATISVPGGAVTTGADGTAQVTLGMEPGQIQLRASKPGAIRETESVCLGTGDDGRCGKADKSAPQARITAVKEGATYTAADAPRELKGTVAADPAGLLGVKLRLTRRSGGKCWYFSGGKEEFRETRCGRSFPFAIGDRADWSYLLPSALKPGRYVFDVIAIDKSYNRDALARGRNRVVFTVR